MAAPHGNKNALKNGSKSRVCRGAKLRKHQTHIERTRNAWLRKLESEVIDQDGAISSLKQATIETIGDCLAHKMILQQRYSSAKSITLADETLILESIQRADQTMLKHIRSLGVSDSPSDTSDEFSVEVDE